MTGRPLAEELVRNPGAILLRTDLERLGWPRRAVDAIFRELEPVILPGYSRPAVRVADYLDLIEQSRWRDDRVRSRHT